MFTVPAFIDAVRSSIASPDPAESVFRLLSEAISQPAAVDAALQAEGLVTPDRPQYAVLHQSADLTVLHVVLPGGLEGPPHNHLAWVAIGMMRGREESIQYRRSGAGLVETGRQELRAPGVMVLPADAIHRIRNPLAERSHALHVYGGSLANPARSLWNPFTMREERFDIAALERYEQEMQRSTASPAAAG